MIRLIFLLECDSITVKGGFNMIGENLRDIKKIDDDKIKIVTKEGAYIYKASGEWLHDAWIYYVPHKINKGIIRKINNDGYCMSIITDGGYNDIELRVEFGYCGSFIKQ